MEKIIDYKMSPEAMVMVAGSSIGTQKKFYEKGYWYKQNNIGYEGTAECLASKVLSCSNITDYVSYEKCKINGCDGCRSANFLSAGESYISLQRLYDTYYGGQLSERIRILEVLKDRIEYTVEFVNRAIGLDIKEQLGKILTFDMLILNTDRHFNNIGIIADVPKNVYRNAPVFDNGNSLLSNMGEYPFDIDLKVNIEKVIGQPFAANLERQAMELGFGLKVNYLELQKILYDEPDSRAMQTLQYQLERYESILKDDTLHNTGTKGNKRDSVLDKLQKNKNTNERERDGNSADINKSVEREL